jgi:hypothetical protein
MRPSRKGMLLSREAYIHTVSIVGERYQFANYLTPLESNRSKASQMSYKSQVAVEKKRAAA